MRRAGRARSEYPSYGLDAAGGLVSTAYDLAQFEIDARQHDRPVPLSFSTLDQMWSNADLHASTTSHIAMPTGLGWFVTTESGQRLVWTFGHIPDAGSALIVKMTVRRPRRARPGEAPDADPARQQRRPGAGLRSRERQRHLVAVRESLPAPVHLIRPVTALHSCRTAHDAAANGPLRCVRAAGVCRARRAPISSSSRLPA